MLHLLIGIHLMLSLGLYRALCQSRSHSVYFNLSKDPPLTETQFQILKSISLKQRSRPFLGTS